MFDEVDFRASVNFQEASVVQSSFTDCFTANQTVDTIHRPKTACIPNQIVYFQKDTFS